MRATMLTSVSSRALECPPERLTEREPERVGERLLAAAEHAGTLVENAIPESVRKVAWAVAMPPYLALALGSAGAVLGGTVGGFGGPLGLVAGGLWGAAMGGTAGAVLGAQLALGGLGA